MIKGPDPELDGSDDDSDSGGDSDDDYRAQIEDWMEGDQPRLEFPPGLTPHHRQEIHEVAEGLGLRHRSIGQNERRRVVVERRLPPVARPDPPNAVADPVPQALAPQDPPPERQLRASCRTRRAPAHLNDYVVP